MAIRRALLLAAAFTGFAATARAQPITGAGSSFGAPLYAKWGEAAKQATGVKLNYQAIGSGGGQNQIINRVVDFGASDAPMPAAALAEHHLMQFPSVIGAVDIVVNLPGIAPNELKLSGAVLAGIFHGTISNWMDPRIAALNPGVKLPDLDVAPVHRADGSGTTFVFTDYLSMQSPEWKDKVGSNTSVNWPAGTGARGNDGVAATVRNVGGAIGYVEAAYAMQNHLVTAQLRNKAGAWVSPAPDTFAAAANGADWAAAKNFAVDLNDEPGAKAWPIMSATYVLLPTDPKDKERNDAVVRLFQWGFKNGDAIANDLHYVPLPQTVKDQVRQEWQKQLKG